jgi:TolB-like protein/Tfp pilus assembly protein PilF
MNGQEAAKDLLFDGLRLNRRGLFRVEPTGIALPVALGSRALDLLLLLAAREGQVVSKRELLAEVWPGIAVEDSNLTKQISALRRTLDRDPGIGSCIQTVPSRGYRFVAPLTSFSRPTVDTLSPADTERPSIAVLPFRNLTDNATADYFADGISEDVTTAIARFPWLFVVARNASSVFGRRAVDPRRAGRELGVRYVLQGSVRTDGDRVRVGGELSDATTAQHIWGDRFEGTRGDIFALQDRVAAAIAGAIEPRLRLAEIERASRRPVRSLDAHDFNLRALAQMSKRTEQGLAEAVRLLHRALNFDPGYAPAMAQLGYVRLMQTTRHWIAPAGTEAEEAVEIAQRAMAEARDDPEVLTASGHTLGFFLGDTEAALGAFDRAIDLNPNYAHAFHQQAMILAWLNRPESAIAAAERAMRLSPRDPDRFVGWLSLAWAHLAAGRYEEAMHWTDHALRENTGGPALRLKLSLCGHLGRHDEAKAYLRRLRDAHREGSVAAVKRALGKGKSAEVVAHLTEGLRKADLPEQ